LVWFALPTLNEESAKEVLHTLADLNLGFVTDKPVRSSPVTNVVFQGGDKFAVMPHPIDVANGGVTTNKKNSSGRPIIYGGSIGENEVARDIFTPTMDVECWVGGPVGTAK
jgi:hypothetical protein